MTRRGVVALFGSAAAALFAPHARAAVPACVVRPAQTEGPYFVDEKLNRSDVRGDVSGTAVRSGIPLMLTFNVSRARGSSCSPSTDATVDIWHCDAAGQYSDVQDQMVGFNTKGQKWLRGFQATDSSGKAGFTTIFPGWYQGRAVHVHFKIRSGTSTFTSQLYFDDALIAQAFAQAPYNTKKGAWLRNDQDGLYRRGGANLMLPLTRSGEGYAGSFDIALQS